MESMTKDFTLLKTSLVSLSYLSRLTLFKRRDLSLVSMRKCHLMSSKKATVKADN